MTKTTPMRIARKIGLSPANIPRAIATIPINIKSIEEKLVILPDLVSKPHIPNIIIINPTT